MCDRCTSYDEAVTSEVEKSFAAGVMAGDGCFKGSGSYFRLALMMQDHAVVERVARCFSALASTFEQQGVGPRIQPLRVHYQWHSKTGKTFARIWLGGPRALHIATLLLPYLGNSDKAADIDAALALNERL